MKTLLFLLLLATLPAGANDTTLSHSFVKALKQTELTVTKIKMQDKSTIIKNISVLDCRADQDRLGVYASIDQKLFELILPPNLALDDLLNDKLAHKETGTHELLFVVKDLWMTEILATLEDNRRDGRRQSFATRLQCRIDVFIHEQGKYFALHKIDTSYIKLNVLERCANELVEDLLNNSKNEVIKKVSERHYTRKRAFELDAIKSHYTNLNVNAERIKTTHTEGVYRTYADFLNNTPTYTNFRIIAGKKEPARLHTVDEKGTEIPLHSIWGVQHQGKTYIMQDRMLFQVFNVGEAWYWVGVKYIESKPLLTPMVVPLSGGWMMAGMEGLGTKVKFRLTPYLLNLENGMPY